MKKQYYYKAYKVVFGHKLFICAGTYNYVHYHVKKWRKANGYLDIIKVVNTNLNTVLYW